MRWLVAVFVPACLSLPARPPDTTSDGAVAVDAPRVDAPPLPPALFGSDMIYGASASLSSGDSAAANFIPGTDGTVRSVLVYVASPATGSMLVAGLYDDNGGAQGVPGGKLEEGSVVIADTPGWVRVSIADTAVTHGAIYWLAVMCPTPGSSCAGFHLTTMMPPSSGSCDEQANSCFATTSGGGSSLPSPWGSSASDPANTFSIYASEQ